MSDEIGMKKELFGVFGDREQFERFRATEEFDVVCSTDSVTAGIRDVSLGVPGRSAAYEDEGGACLVWGEAFPDDDTVTQTGKWLLARYREEGTDALSRVNGSHLAVIDDGGGALVATDQIQSWECFYTDDPGVRVFGTDAARIARTIEDAGVDDRSQAEFIHFGVVFGTRTLLSELKRVPFDGYITGETEDELARFVYEPKEFDYVAELADRLERAIRRRARYPGTKGILMSAGYDSRAIISTLPELDVCYTLGTSETPEVQVAREVAAQFGIEHQLLEVNERYLDMRPEVVQYTQGIRESLHIHHRGNVADLQTETMYHGLLLDSLLRGHYRPNATIELFDLTFPLTRLDPDPDVAAFFGKKLGFFSNNEVIADCEELDARTTEEFVEQMVRPEYEKGVHRADSTYNAISTLGMKLTPPMPFRVHLADNHVESFIACDAELIDWHLSTPPKYRTDETYLRAIQRIDGDILEHRPPDRPHDSYQLNQIEGFVRRQLPGVDPFGTPWPDRDVIYDQLELDRTLFPGYEEIHALEPRIKLRIADIIRWLHLATGDETRTPDQTICPQV